MKNIISILIAVSSLTGCKSTKPVIIVAKDSVVIKDTTIYKTVTEYLPGDTVEMWQAIPCPDAVIDAEVKKSNTTLQVNVSKGVMKVRCNTDSLKHVIDSLIRIKEKEVYHTERVEVPVDKPVPYIPKWVWYLVAITTALGGWTLRKPLLKIIGR